MFLCDANVNQCSIASLWRSYHIYMNSVNFKQIPTKQSKHPLQNHLLWDLLYRQSQDWQWLKICKPATATPTISDRHLVTWNCCRNPSIKQTSSHDKNINNFCMPTGITSLTECYSTHETPWSLYFSQSKFGMKK